MTQSSESNEHSVQLVNISHYVKFLLLLISDVYNVSLSRFQGAEIDTSQVDAPVKKAQSTKTENDRHTEEFVNLLYGRPSKLDPSNQTKEEEIVVKADETSVDNPEEKIIVEEIVIVQKDKIDDSKNNETPRVELTAKAKVVSNEQRNEAQTKDQGMSYWHMWPLYYFA